VIDVATRISPDATPRPRGVWIIMTAVMVAAVVAAASRISDVWARHRTADNLANSEVHELKRRLNELELEQRRQRMLSSSLARAVEQQQQQPQGGGPAVPTVPASVPEDSAPPAPRPSSQEQYRTLESKFAAEKVDDAWAAPTESRIRDVVAKFQRTTLLSSSCRSTMCRLQLSFADMQAREEFEAESVQQVPFTNTHVWMQRNRGEDGNSFSTVMLVSRGGPLPVP
jgi:hypothetical protein